MIKYRLGCPQQHEFESWFRSSADFDTLVAAGMVACADCGSVAIEKLPMAPALLKSSAPVRSAQPVTPPDPTTAEGRKEIVRQLREFKAAIEANAENVGSRFADEARRIHYGEADERNIYGASTADEVRGLAEEGIDFGIVPPLPEDKN